MVRKIQNQPVGIFDSGIGGLTIAHALKEKLPNESIVYFGDTEHLPYGEKSNLKICNLSKKITRFLEKKKCKAIVIACNSASSIAYNTVKKVSSIPVFNVIDPVTKYIVQNFSPGKIGVIGTKATIKSNVYRKKILSLCQDSKVVSLATPLLAPMIEEGFVNEKISKTIIQRYLSNKVLKNINYLILACTHYPLIVNEINNFYKRDVTIIDSSNVIANSIKEELINLELICNNKPKYDFYVSNYTKSFEDSARYFFKKEIKLKGINIWK